MKNIVRKLIKDEKGQAMLLAVILLLVCGLIVASLLSFMGTGLLVNPVYEGRVAELYGADAGVEDAVLKIQQGIGLCLGQSKNYTIDDVNDKTVAVTITCLSNITSNAIYLVQSIATGDGSGTLVEAYVTATSKYGDYSGILENVLTSQNGIELSPNVEVNPEEGEHAPIDYYGGIWPPPEELAQFYWQDVKGEPEYGSGIIDLNGVDMTLGPIYRNGTLDIYNSINTPATLTLTGTIYITGDTSIGQTKNDFTLALNGQTIFVASNSSDPQKALWIGGKCIIEGPGVIVAIGDIYFEPNIEAGMTEPIFIMSVSGTTNVQPGGDFYGSVAGSVEVDFQPGTTMNYPEDEGWYEGLNFPLGITESQLVYSIASWQVTPLSPEDFAE